MNWAGLSALTFEEPDECRFPCLKLAREALLLGRSAPAVLNAANEVAVAAFLAGRLPFTGIANIIQSVLESTCWLEPDCIDAVLQADSDARRAASRLVERWQSP
jgi:1-deoxy-D-xylulose-5-phosphate reductoisomerase